MNNRLTPISLFMAKCTYDIIFYGNIQLSEMMVATMCIFGSFKIVELSNSISWPKLRLYYSDYQNNNILDNVVEIKQVELEEHDGSIIDVVLDADTMINNSKRLCDKM